MYKLAVGLMLCGVVPSLLPAQLPAPVTGANLRGTITDPSGALIPGAEIELASGASNTVLHPEHTGPDGRYSFAGLPPGTYVVRVKAEGFAPFEHSGVNLGAGKLQTFDVRMQIETQQAELNVSAESGEATDPEKNADAVILSGQRLDDLPTDPTELQQELQQMSGGDSPAIFVDGFSGGAIPPKNTIREIRINQNPFSARNDTDPTAGQIEILTKPGTDKVHGDMFLIGSDSALNTQNPFTANQPAYNSLRFNVDLSGPISRKSSYNMNAGRFSDQINSVVKAEVLDANLNQGPFTQALPSPSTNTNFSPRVDLQIGAKSTVSLRYAFSESKQTNGGVGQLNLASQGFDSDTISQTFQGSNSQVFGARVVNDTRFQYIRTRTQQTPLSTAPTLNVEGAFTGGGSNAGAFHDNQDRYELQNYLSISAGKHYLSPGVRLRVQRDANVSRSGFNGQFVFPTLSAYQVTQQMLAGCAATPATCPTDAQIRAAGGGASQFTLTSGSPAAVVNSVDFAAFFQDDWKIRKTFTLSYGLRYETQNYIGDEHDFAPRLGFAWQIGVKKDKPPLLVLRGGTGLFYTRLASTNILQAVRENGVSQQQYTVANPSFYPNVPASPGALGAQSSPTIYRINPGYQAPYAMDNTIQLEHPLGTIGNLMVNYIYNRGDHLLLTRNINAPLPGTYNPAAPTSGVRPFGGTQNIDEYESAGVSRTRRLSANVQMFTKRRFGLYAYYMLRYRDADASGGFPSNGYDIGADFGRIAQDLRHNFIVSINTPLLPGRIQAGTFIDMNSGAPFNITVGQDLNGDSQFNDRPAFATDLTRSSVVTTKYGAFDTNPIAGQKILPINFGQSPGYVNVHVQVFREFTFGPPLPEPPAPPAKPGAAPPPATKGPRYVQRKYNMFAAVQASNAINHVNLAPPVGVLGSPLFGQSTGLNPLGDTNANRVIDLVLFARF